MTRKLSDEERRAWEAGADDEQIALSRHPRLRTRLEQSRESAKRRGTVPLNQVDAFRDLTPEDDAEGERLLAELERQTEAEEAARAKGHRLNGDAAGTPRTNRDLPATAR